MLIFYIAVLQTDKINIPFMTYKVRDGTARALYFRPCGSLIQDYPDLKMVLTKTDSSEPDLRSGYSGVRTN